eukprot:scaffold8162_cov183-Amphora_coffeaeformis.AAC.4
MQQRFRRAGLGKQIKWSSSSHSSGHETTTTTRNTLPEFSFFESVAPGHLGSRIGLQAGDILLHLSSSSSSSDSKNHENNQSSPSFHHWELGSKEQIIYQMRLQSEPFDLYVLRPVVRKTHNNTKRKGNQISGDLRHKKLQRREESSFTWVPPLNKPRPALDANAAATILSTKTATATTPDLQTVRQASSTSSSSMVKVTPPTDQPLPHVHRPADESSSLSQVITNLMERLEGAAIRERTEQPPMSVALEQQQQKEASDSLLGCDKSEESTILSGQNTGATTEGNGDCLLGAERDTASREDGDKANEIAAQKVSTLGVDSDRIIESDETTANIQASVEGEVTSSVGNSHTEQRSQAYFNKTNTDVEVDRDPSDKLESSQAQHTSETVEVAADTSTTNDAISTHLSVSFKVPKDETLFAYMKQVADQPTEWDGPNLLMDLPDDPRDVIQFVENNGLESALGLMGRHSNNHLHTFAWRLVDTTQRWLDCRDRLLSLGIHNALIRSLQVCETGQLFHVIACMFLSPVMDSDASLRDFTRTRGAIPALLNAMGRQCRATEALTESFLFLDRCLVHSTALSTLHDIDGLSKVGKIMDRFKEPALQSAGKQVILKLIA